MHLFTNIPFPMSVWKVFLFLVHFVHAYIYLSKIKVTDEECTFACKVSKKLAVDTITVDLKEVGLVAEHKYFNSNKWLGLPWESVKTVTFKVEDVVLAHEFYCLNMTYHIKTCHYYALTVNVENDEFFTCPVYHCQFKFVYPLTIKDIGTKLKMGNEKRRMCSKYYDEYSKYFWLSYIPFYIMGVITAMVVVGILVRAMVRANRGGIELEYTHTKIELNSGTQ